MKTKEEKQAEAQGFSQVTEAYNLSREQQLLDKVIADMVRGNIPYILVTSHYMYDAEHPVRLGKSLWRK